jgi:hypothetical protein
LLTNDLNDENDVFKQVCSLYHRAKLLLRKFLTTQVHIKLMLLNAFCSPIYGSQLWCKFRNESFNHLRVHNIAVYLFLNVPPWSNANEVFVSDS